MKKLVKTAKQQFEERLSELKVVDKESTDGNFTYYLCEDDSERCIILECGEGTYPIYSEISMSGTIHELYTDEDFLDSLVDYWTENIRDPLKRLFDWYASADKDNPPFGIGVIAKCASNGSVTSYSDLYEEVPDVRIITAKEQWEKASANSILVQQSGDDLYKVEVTDTDIIFYTFRHGAYQKEIFPSFYELRNDSRFVIDYLSFVRDSHPDDMEAAFEWLAGRKYTMGDVTLLDIFDVANRKSVYCYEECSVNEVAKMNFANEAESLRKKLVSHIENLCELGLTINQEVLCSRYTMSCADGDALLTDPSKDFYTLKNDAAEWILCYRIGVLETESYHLNKLSIDTLLHIIESLQ